MLLFVKYKILSLICAIELRCWDNETKKWITGAVEIIRILNYELKKEIRHQFKNLNFNGDTITLLKEFSIDENKILSVEIRKNNTEVIL